MLKIKRVIVGLSGGVDSAVTALLLKNKGYDVHGVFMQNWDIADEKGQCSADKDYKDAIIVSKKLNIPLHYVNFVKHYWNFIFWLDFVPFSNLIKDYETGYTPNPDILCNRHIKFDYFFRYAKENLGADAIATGHYAKTSFGPFLEHYDPDKNVRLLRAKSAIKDQTFFLSQIKQDSLRLTMFPIGDLMKAKVKEIAFENGLDHVANKKESMGICFIGSRNFQPFISEYIENKPGNFIDLDTSKIIGEHQGIHHWTIGQRSRLQNCRVPAYIAKKVLKTNNIFVVLGRNHLALFTDLFFTTQPHWIESRPRELVNSVLMCDFKFQHVDIVLKCTVCETKEGLIVSLEAPRRAITPGQYAVFYRDNECIGSARISCPGCSLYFTNKYKIKHRNKYNDFTINNDSEEKQIIDEIR